MSIPALPSLDRTSPTFRTDLDTFFLSQLPATTAAFNGEIDRINGIGYGSYSATSSTSLSIATGSKSLTIEAGKSFSIGQPVLIANTAAPANWMHGQVTAYDSGTGALTVTVGTISGGGTAAAWSVSVTAAVASAPPTVLQRTITGADTLISSDQGKLINASGTFTLSVTAAATLGNGWYCWLRNTSNGDVTVDPASTEQIDGATTYVLKPGFTVLVACDGAAFTTLKVKERTYTNIASYTASGTFVVPADTYVIRGYAWGKGGDASGLSTPGAGGGCAYGDIAVTPGESVTVSIVSGVATVTTAATARLTGNNAVTTTAGAATKHASVTNGGAYSGGSVGGGVRGGSSSGSPLGTGKQSAADGGSSWAFASTGTPGAGLGESVDPVTAFGGGSLRTPANAFTDPLLAPLTGIGGMSAPGGTTAGNGGNGGPGGGGGAGGFTYGGNGGKGGIGAGGGGCNSSGSTANGGNGGFGGGGGGCWGATSNYGGNGGLGGGGGGAADTGYGTGGAACVLIYY